MKKLFISLSMLFILFSTNLVAFAQQPDYQKYGRMAMAVVKEDFPGDPIKEYEYLGRKKVSDTQVEDSFKFQVQEQSVKYVVTVKVNHNITNNKLVSIVVDSQKQ